MVEAVDRRHVRKGQCDIQEPAGEAFTVDAVRKAADTMHCTMRTGGFRTWIIAEACAMTLRAVQAWPSALDEPQPRVPVIFTTIEDSANLLGRNAAGNQEIGAGARMHDGGRRDYAMRIRCSPTRGLRHDDSM